MEILSQSNYLSYLASAGASNLQLQNILFGNGENPFASSSSSSSSSSYMMKQNGSSTSTTPTSNSPSPSPNSMIGVNQSNWRKCCTNTSCLLCTRGTPRCLSMNHPSWTLILRVVFYALAQIHQDKEFFNLKKEVYVYLNDHWDILSPTQAQSNNWKRQVQDALSHSRFFRSGRHTLRCNGYWQLKLSCNPWNYSSSKQFEALRFEDVHPPYSPSQQIQQHGQQQQLQQQSPPMAPEISWRIKSRGPSPTSTTTTTSNSSMSMKDQQSPKSSSSKITTSTTSNSYSPYQRYDKDKVMDIKKLLSLGMASNSISNSNYNFPLDSDEDLFDISSPLSSDGNSSYQNNNNNNNNSNSGSPYSHSVSTFNHPSNFKFIHPKKPTSSSTSSLSPISSPYLSDSQLNSSSNINTPSFPTINSSPSFAPPFQLTPPSNLTSNSNNNNNSQKTPLSSPSKLMRPEFDDELISKIHQMKSILNCTD